MANEVFKTPDVYLKEVDNTFVRDTSNTVFGTGAITLKANQGPVNQRLLFTRFRDFQQVFGKPTTTTDYGHFAARLYMSVAPSLYVVRASYGDEHYATIQYPREVKADYINYLSAGNPYIKITTTAEVSDLVNLVKVDSTNLSDSGYKDVDGTNYVYTSKGVIPDEGIYKNVVTNLYSKGIFSKAELDDGVQTSGTYITLPTYNDIINIMCINSGDAPSGVFVSNMEPKSTSDYGDLLSGISSFNGEKIDSASLPSLFKFDKNSKEFNGEISDYNNLLNLYLDSTSNIKSASYTQEDGINTPFYNAVSGKMYIPFAINVNKDNTLNGKQTNVYTYISPNALSGKNTFNGNYSTDLNSYGIKYVNYSKDLANLYSSTYYSNSSNYDSYTITKISKSREWESNLEIENLYISGTPLLSGKEVRSINFTNFNMGDEENWLVVGYTKAENVTSCSQELINAIYENYGTNSIEAKDYIPYIAVRVDRYASNVEDLRLPDFCSGTDFEDMNLALTRLNKNQIELTPNADPSELKVDLLLTNGEIVDNDKLFAVYQDVNDDMPKTFALHNISKINHPTVPVNIENTNNEHFDKDDKIKEVVAIPTNQALVMYPDGYTKTCDTDEEPGIGDLESIKPWNGSSLVIGAIGPGKYANDLGISIVTPDQYEIKALNIPNAFDWRWRFDDEDKNKKTPSSEIKKMISMGGDYPDDTKKLIWTQVYKVNVYRKPSDKTAEDAWGTGKEAMASNIPVESFLVSNDPKLVDGEGKSLYAPNVINAQSNFIYISRRSVQSMDKKLPNPTFGIFPLVGGKDGTKSGINQKQAALQLYSDPNKANFDLIFNTDAIESFASREKYKGAQITFGEIAGSRGDAFAITQATSKEAKKLAKAQAEGKGFSFEYPSFVAMYAGYDKYFDPDLSSYVYLPKSVAAAVTEGWIMYNRNPWDAPAGVENGSIEYTTGSQLLNINADELGELYSNNINCSRTMPIYGEVLWGNKTAQKKNTALRSINVRILLNYIKKNVKQILTPYIFQINNDTTRTRMKNQLTNFLGGIEQQGGCTDSRVRVWCSGEDLMNHIVRVELGFIPPYTIEFIPVNIVLDSAANTIDILEA